MQSANAGEWEKIRQKKLSSEISVASTMTRATPVEAGDAGVVSAA